MREAQEEVNLELKDVEVLGEISSVQSRFGLSVTPYIGILKSNSLIADGKEIAEVFSVPLNFIKDNMQKEQKSENWDNKKVFFISGVAGFLGSHLADRLIELNHKVIGCDNLIGGYEDNIPDKVEFHNVNCNNFEKMSLIMKNVYIVYHLSLIHI